MDGGPPTIVIDRELDDLPVSQVMVANHHGGWLAGQHLLDLGHRDVAVIAGPGSLGTSARRLEGFREAYEAAGIGIRPQSIARGDFRAVSGRAAMDQLLGRRRRPTAVFAENDLMALGALSAAHAAGLDIPADLSVVGFDGIAFGADVTPTLTTVMQSSTAVAAAAVELLLERLRDAAMPPRRIELPVLLAERGSSGPPGRR